MSRVLHLSDPHFGTEVPAIVAALHAFARAHPPDLVVLSGDITQRARRAQFDAARRFVDALGAPVLAIPGNHDVPLFNLPARLFAPYHGYARCFGALAPVHDSPALLAIGVNTTRWWRHKHGELSAEQVEAVCVRLRRAGAPQLRLVVIHQPLLVTHPEDLHDCLRARGLTRPEALRCWALAGADLVLSGHIHRAFALPFDAGGRELWCIQAGTAVSRRIRRGEPNSVNLIHWQAARCTVERWSLRTPGGSFEPVARLQFQPGR